MRNKGWKGFAETSFPNASAQIIKESLRWPVISVIYQTLLNYSPEMFPKGSTNSMVATGLLTAVFNSSFLLPFEFLISHRIKTGQSYPQFFLGEFKKEGIRSLYPGVKIHFIRQCISWTLFMGMNNEFLKLRQVYDADNAHPHLYHLLSSSAIASVGVGIGLPLDFVKTRFQMDASLRHLTIQAATRNLFRQFGITGFYAGGPIVLIHTMFQALIKAKLLDIVVGSKK
jgi:hypothetical protein